MKNPRNPLAGGQPAVGRLTGEKSEKAEKLMNPKSNKAGLPADQLAGWLTFFSDFPGFLDFTSFLYSWAGRPARENYDC